MLRCLLRNLEDIFLGWELDYPLLHQHKFPFTDMIGVISINTDPTVTKVLEP